VRLPPCVTLAVAENVAEPEDAVWLDGCDEIVMTGTGAGPVNVMLPLFVNV